MLAAGPQAGKLIWIKPKHSAPKERRDLPGVAASGPSAPATAEAPPVADLLAQRRSKHMNRRIARLAELTREQLEAFEARTLSLPTLVGLASVFGTNQNRKNLWSFGSSSDPWTQHDSFTMLAPEEAATTLWALQLLPVLTSRLQYGGPADATRLHREVLGALKLLGASYPDLYRAVARELPEPKAWTQLPGYEPEDLEAEPPLPAPSILACEPYHELLDENVAQDAITA